MKLLLVTSLICSNVWPCFGANNVKFTVIIYFCIYVLGFVMDMRVSGVLSFENREKLLVLSTRTSMYGKGKLSFGLARFRSR